MSNDVESDCWNDVEWLWEHKCAESDCWNYAERGYIYCIHHLHGFPERISDEDIERMKRHKILGAL